MALLYKNAKKEVDQEFDELTKAGWKPVANPDGKTFHWENAKGEIRRGAGEPTQGIAADAGFLKRNFKREARQDRLMSEKVTAMLALPGTKSIVNTGTGGGNEGKTDGATGNTGTAIPRDASTNITIPTKAQTSNLTLTGKYQPPTVDTTTLAKGPVMPVVPISRTTEVAPYASAVDKNIKDPYIYVDREEWKKNNPWWSRSINNVWGGTNIGDIEQIKAGMNNSSFGMAGVGPRVPRVREVEGQEQVLIENPNYQKPIIPKNVVGNILQDVQGLIAPGSLLGPNRVVMETLPMATIAGVKSMQATKAAKKAGEKSEATSKVGKWVSGKLQKKSTKATEKANEWGERAAREFEKANVGVKPTPAPPKAATKAAEQVVPGGKVPGEATFKFNIKTKTPTSTTKALGPRKVPTGKVVSPSTGVPFRMGSGNIYELPASPLRRALPAGYACGGKLKPKSKMKGKGK